LAIAIPAILIMSTHTGTNAQTTIKSPQGAVQATVSADADGRLVYAVRFEGRQVLAPSPIGVIIDGINFGAGVEVGPPDERNFELKFPWRGNHAEVNISGRSAAIPIRSKSGTGWTLEVKCFDSGVAYRCVIPGEGLRKVTGEAAAWELPAGTL